MNDELMRKEVQEAIDAGERALMSLRKASEKLDSARNWGIFDMFGGDFLSGLVKHSKLNDASAYLTEAKRDLQIFQRELRDVQVPMDIRIEIGGFLSFADFFFDGLVADYLVQSKIGQAREEVAEAISRVTYLLQELTHINGQER